MKQRKKERNCYISSDTNEKIYSLAAARNEIISLQCINTQSRVRCKNLKHRDNVTAAIKVSFYHHYQI